MTREEGYNDFIHRLFQEQDKNKKAVKTITFQVTEDCCLRCTYCYQHKKSSKVMTFETAKQAIDDILTRSDKVKSYIDSYDTLGVIIDFIGGEPLMAIDLISQISDYFIEKMIELDHPWLHRYRFSICSNGVLYFDPKVQEYIKKHFNHLSFSISIDGNKELHDSCRVFADGSGSYDIAMKAVRHYVDVLKGHIGSKVTLSPENIEHTFSAVKSLIENGYDVIHMNCVFEEGWKTSHATVLYQQLKQLSDYIVDNELVDKVYISMLDEIHGHTNDSDQNWCGGTGAMLAVDAEGEYYPCLRYMNSSLNGKQDPYTIGNLDLGIGKEQLHAERIELLSSITKTSQSTEKCLTCPISSGCAWCSAYNYEVFGTPNKRATFICEMHQARVLAISYLWNTWYIKTNSEQRYSLDIPKDWAINIVSEDEFKMLKELSNGNNI